ncbi:MAG: hypothetical protein HYR60_11685 [Acidobacteria bacterium]|nr:hypothetical protein [Acidobacteriota bacterium]
MSGKVSPLLQRVIDGGLFDRLPVTFGTYAFDQIKEWDLLFPAEQSYFERLFGLLDRSEAKRVEELFAPLRQIEQKMGVNEKVWPKRQFSLDQVDFLNRNAHYPEWRKAVADLFGRLDPLLEEEIARKGRPRLVVVSSPAELPVGPDRMWTRLREYGRVVALEGQESALARLTPVAELYSAKNAASRYETWLIDAGESLPAAVAGAVSVSYARLARYRSRLMQEVNRLVNSEQIRGPRQLAAKLKELKLSAAEGEVARDPVLAEFVRAILLAGNGTLLVNNTFAEWATVQAVRRARPSVVLVWFGIRNKVKPFSSLLIYADQEQSNPIPTQMDTLGSYVDLEVFYQYVWQEFEKYAEYRRNTVYLFLGEGMDGMFVIAPPDFSLGSANEPLKMARIVEQAKDWLNL